MSKKRLTRKSIEKIVLIATMLTAFGFPAVAKAVHFAPPPSHAGKIFDIQFSPDDKKLASTNVDQTIKLWDVATGKELTAINVIGD